MGHLFAWLCEREAFPFESCLKSEQAEIILRARSGDLDACRQIHEDYARRILNFIYKMVDSREDAEDLTQNVFLRSFQELRNLHDPERFEPWLFRIARNEVYQAFRKKRGEPQKSEAAGPGRQSELQEPESPDFRQTPQDRMLSDELGATIRTVLRSLPPKLREVFVLAVIHEKSYAEISEIVGRSLLSVKTDIFRARGYARKELSQYLEVQKR
ncbi:MAG: polymerase sigma factor SigW [Acidobacteria bacterium]|nr:polymerase sigma factor SigW [Acidobacteriota bacterium]